MADDNTNDSGQGQGSGDGNSGGAENFWKDFDSHLDAWFARKEKEAAAKKGPGTSRTGGSTGIPSILANIMGGPFQKQDLDARTGAANRQRL